MIYLAGPYSDPNPAVREARYRAMVREAARLMAEGNRVFAPIVHSHPIAEHLPDDVAHDHHFWMAQDLPMLWGASSVHVLKLPGWRVSRGLSRELIEAWKRDIAVIYIDV